LIFHSERSEESVGNYVRDSSLPASPMLDKAGVQNLLTSKSFSNLLRLQLTIQPEQDAQLMFSSFYLS